jgi:flavin reductase (DIM6/NTAB) family NADH-FMN oxidoreductase RutF
VSRQRVGRREACGVTSIQGKVGSVPLIAERSVNPECTVEQEICFHRDNARKGIHVLVIGRVVQLHATDRISDMRLLTDGSQPKRGHPKGWVRLTTLRWR